MPERSGNSTQPVSYDLKMLSMQQEQLISSLWRALPQQTINDPMDSQLQNSHLYQALQLQNVLLAASTGNSTGNRGISH